MRKKIKGNTTLSSVPPKKHTYAIIELQRLEMRVRNMLGKCLLVVEKHRDARAAQLALATAWYRRYPCYMAARLAICGLCGCKKVEEKRRKEKRREEKREWVSERERREEKREWVREKRV